MKLHIKECRIFFTIVSAIVMIVYMNFYSLFFLIHLSGPVVVSIFLFCFAILGWIFGKNIRIDKSMINPCFLWISFLIFQFVDIFHSSHAIKTMFHQLMFFLYGLLFLIKLN